MTKECSVEGCDKPVYARGWCRKHYRQVIEGKHPEPRPVVNKCSSCQQPLTKRASNNTLCKKCYYKEWIAKNKESLQGYKKEYSKTNKDTIRQVIASWRDRNRNKINAYYQRKRQDIQHRLAHNLRSRLYDSLKDKVKLGSAVQDCGLSVNDLQLYLESLWSEGMTWENYGTMWSVDHIIPLVAFDLTDRVQFLKAVHYTNLRPLWNSEQFSKSIEDKKRKWNK